MSSLDTQVLIIGGGPVGLALAAELGLRGIDATLVEQGDGRIVHPRANTVNSRSMEFCRRWGIAEEVRQSGAPPDFPPTILYVTTLQGHEIARIERPTHGGHQPLATTPERSQRCNQLFFDPIMRRLAARQPSVNLRYRCRFESFEERDGGVVAKVRDLASDRVETIAARFLVACCGGQSSVRETLGVRMEGDMVLSYHLNIFVRIPELWTRHDKGKAAFYFFVDRAYPNSSLIELDGDALWRLDLNDERERLSADSVDVAAAMRHLVGAGVPYEVISSLPWTCRSIVADRWRRGPVFLAGDAVHQHGPAGGFGMNTGLGDAVDLGWKLAAALEGWGGEELLASYQAERRPVAQRVVAEVRENIGSLTDDATLAVVADEGQAGARARADLREDILRRRTRVFLSDGIALGYRYEPSPVVIGDGTPAPVDSVSTYTPTSRPGSRAPHAWLSPGRSTIDLFGKGFVLLAFSGAERDAEGLASAAAACGVPLSIEAVGDPTAARAYERRLVLVRPDGHVAWRGDTAPIDPQSVIDFVRGAANSGGA